MATLFNMMGSSDVVSKPAVLKLCMNTYSTIEILQIGQYFMEGPPVFVDASNYDPKSLRAFYLRIFFRSYYEANRLPHFDTSFTEVGG